jgi:hypothetical protein
MMIQVQDKHALALKEHNFQCSNSLLESDAPLIQAAREWSIKLQTDYNWAAILIQLSEFSQEFRCQVWQFWQMDVFGETDFLI